MDNYQQEKRISWLYAKGRNIIYYRSIDDRPRAQYMHILRDFRKEAKELLDKGSISDPYTKNAIEGIINLIPPKVKTEECDEVIKQLNEKIYNNVIK